MENLDKIQALIKERAEAEARLNLIPYDGSPEVKENSSGRYLYIRKRVAGKLTSKYVDVYSDDLYQLLLRNAREARELKKSIRKITRELAELGYTPGELNLPYTTKLFLKAFPRRSHRQKTSSITVLSTA